MDLENRRLGHVRILFGIWLFGLLQGCQAPPAHLSACNPDGRVPSRKAVLRRQKLVDTCVYGIYHPLATGKYLAGKMTNHIPARHERPAALSGCRSGQVQLYPEGHEALAALEAVIDQATCRIDVLMYIWDSDPLGESIAVRLAAKAGPQLPVRVLVDGGGNMTFGLPKEASAAEVNRVVCWLAHQPYVQVIRTRNPGRHYDHRKLVAVDGHLAWTGGRNFSEQGFYRQHDLSFTVAGPLVADYEKRFECFWEFEGGKPLPPLKAAEVPDPNAWAEVIGTDPPHLELRQALYARLDAARHHVYLENFSLCDPGILRRLIQARQRGTDVRVILTIESTSAAMNHANKVTANQLLDAGVRVYLYPGMTHVKAMSVDGCWAYTGTGNFDPISMYRNHEIGLAIADGPAIAELEERLFLPDLCPAWELKEPLPVSTIDRIYQWVAKLAL